MAADHINIRHPDQNAADSPRARTRLHTETLKTELRVLRECHDELQRDLEAIFTRIDRGQIVELHYPDNRVIRVKAYKEA